jgi:PIN domain nuclease of toxin-antitoxin system
LWSKGRHPVFNSPGECCVVLGFRTVAWTSQRPFDRPIIAQALQAGMVVVTVGTVFATYGVKVINARR